MKILAATLKRLVVGLLLVSFGSAFADDDVEYTCEESAENMSSIIDDWYLFVKEYGAEEKNPSVIAMQADHEKGLLVEKLKNQCVATRVEHEDIYTCFSGTRSEMGAAMCLHPDTNKNDWLYQ